MNWALFQNPAPARARVLLTVATALCLAPFLNKAFHIDDPLFLWTAKQIQSHPLDFYGFRANWGYNEMPMIADMQNPPLAAYYSALVTAIFGWSEVALHAAFLLPAIALVLGTYEVAKRFCARPILAGSAVLVAPVFMLCSSSVMCDTMMVAFWVWAMWFWLTGLDQKSNAKLAVSALLIIASGMSKYFGFALVPLLGAYTILKLRRAGWWILFVALPIAGALLFEWITARMYGRGLMANAASYAVVRGEHGALFGKFLITMAFCGGCLCVALFLIPFLWGRRGAIIAILGLLAAVGALLACHHFGEFVVSDKHGLKWAFLLQMAAYVVAGAAIAMLAAGDVLRNRNSESVLLLLWIGGVVIFAGAVNWTISGRNFLPAVPAVALLLARQLEFRAVEFRRLIAPFILSLAAALCFTWADEQDADLQREVAEALTSQLKGKFASIAFEGHWGFQYYMQQLGATPLSGSPLVLGTNQAIIIPLDNTCIFKLPKESTEFFAVLERAAGKGVSVQNVEAGAGYYSDAWGPAPFVFGATKTNPYRVMRTK